MKLDEIMRSVVLWMLWLWIALALMVAVVSCRSVKESETRNEKMAVHDTVRVIQMRVDSVFRLDSVFRERFIAGDTVHDVVTRWKVEYRDRIRVDTVTNVLVKDSVVYEQKYETVEKMADEIWTKLMRMLIVFVGAVFICMAVKWKLGW